MFKMLTTEEKLQREREKNALLLNRQAVLENALFELADVLSGEIMKGGEIDGNAVL